MRHAEPENRLPRSQGARASLAFVVRNCLRDKVFVCWRSILKLGTVKQSVSNNVVCIPSF